MIRFQRFLAAGGRLRLSSHRADRREPDREPGPDAPFDERGGAEAAAKLGPLRHANQAKAFVEPEQLSYPFAYERIAQLFDSPNAPDIVVNPKSYAFGRQPGQHGALDVDPVARAARLLRPGRRIGVRQTSSARRSTSRRRSRSCCGLPLIDGMDSTGRTSTERGVEPDVYLKRQDGKVIEEIVIEGPAREAGARRTSSCSTA